MVVFFSSKLYVPTQNQTCCSTIQRISIAYGVLRTEGSLLPGQAIPFLGDLLLTILCRLSLKSQGLVVILWARKMCNEKHASPLLYRMYY